MQSLVTLVMVLKIGNHYLEQKCTSCLIVWTKMYLPGCVVADDAM